MINKNFFCTKLITIIPMQCSEIMINGNTKPFAVKTINQTRKKLPVCGNGM